MGMVEQMDSRDYSSGYNSASGGLVLQDIDTIIRQVIDAYNQSSHSLWQCAEYTYKLFEEHGMYERHFTDALCTELAVNRDTLYHWRKAWDLKLRISETFPNLTISHYYHCADYLDRMGEEVIHDLLQTANEEKWSVRKLSAEVEMANDESGTLPWLKKKLGIVLARLEKIYGSSDYSGLSDDKRKKLKVALDLICEILK